MATVDEALDMSQSNWHISEESLQVPPFNILYLFKNSPKQQLSLSRKIYFPVISKQGKVLDCPNQF